jgi:opacity protein-like surface antigen
MNSPRRRNYSPPSLAVSLVLAASVLPALGQIPWATEPLFRTGMTEFYGIGQYLHSDDITFQGPYGDVKTKMDDMGLGGFGFAFHFSDFFSVHSDFMFGGATFSGNAPLQTGGTIGFKQDAFISTGRFNLDYNIINRRLTPFVTAGIGYQYVETELKNAPPVNTCWWDPWWGWVCYSGHYYASETDFTWNAGGGLRWNIVDGLMIKALVGATWLEYDHSHGITTQLEGIFSIGWSF